MSKDHYKILGVDKSASKDEIKKAFRKMAHEHHPDKQGGNDAKFKEASEAYSVLSDDGKRKQYDMFGSAGANMGGAGGQGDGQGGGFNPGAGFSGFHGFDFSQFTGGNGQNFEFDLGDLFGDIFGAQRRPRRGKTITVDVQLSFKDAIFGIKKDITVNKEKLTVTIPPGIESGQGLQIASKGEEGAGGRGDLIVRVWVEKHPRFRKEGYNLIMELPLKLTTALGGGTVEIETLDGKIEMKIPTGTTHNDILRVRNKGVPDVHGKRGDLLIVTEVVMPKKLSQRAMELVEELKREGV